MDFLAAIEQAPATRLLKESFYVYPVVNAVHIAAIGVLFTTVWLMDLRIFGAFRTVAQIPFVRLLRRAAVAAFAVALLSGLALFSVRAGEYAAMPVFLVKMSLIALAGLNLLLSLLLGRARSAEAASTSTLVERLAAGLSALLWTAVLLAGRFIGFS